MEGVEIVGAPAGLASNNRAVLSFTSKKVPKKRRAKPKTKLQLEGLPTLEDLLNHLGLTAPDAWDACASCDG